MVEDLSTQSAQRDERAVFVTPASSRAVRGHADVLHLIDEVEQALIRLRGSAGEDAERARVSDQLAEERSALLARQVHLESQLAAHRAELADAVARAERAEALVVETECAARAARMSFESSWMEERVRAAVDNAVAPLEEKISASAALLEASRAEVAAAEAARDHACRVLASAASKLSAVVRTAERHAARVVELEAELAKAQSAQTASTIASASADTQPAATESTVEDAVEREAEIERRVEAALAPKVAQLAQVASFLRLRRERLSALRRGLRHRAKALRAMRTILSMPAPAACAEGVGTAPNTADSGTVAEAPVGRGDEAALVSERDEVERERSELLELRAVLAASEQSIARRAAGTRALTAGAFVAIAITLASVASWHLAGAMVAAPVLATVELETTSRAPEAKTSGATDATPIASWLRTALSTNEFQSVVAGRLTSRGRTQDEAAALVARLPQEAQVEAAGSTVRVALRGAQEDDSVALLDAVAVSAVTEANRATERRTDLLRVGVANARQEVGRTVFTHLEPLGDPGRFTRAAILFAAFAATGLGFAYGMWLVARRAARADAA